MTDADVLGLHVASEHLLARWCGRTKEIPTGATESNDDEALVERVQYAAAAVGAPSHTGTAVVVHPTRWNSRRRELLHTAARHVARNAVLVPVSVAARCAVEAASTERCVVVEVAPQGVTAILVGQAADEGPVAVRVARDPDLDVGLLDTQGGAEELMTLIRAVSGSVEPDVLIVTGVPGEPRGAALCARMTDLIGRGIRLVPVAAVEMLAAVAVPAASPNHAAEATPTARWLQDVRAPMPPPAATRRFRWVPAAVVLAAVAVATLLGFTVVRDEDVSPRDDSTVAVHDPDGFSETDGGMSEPTEPDSGIAPSTRFVSGPVRIDLPSRWRVRAVETGAPERTELLPDSGPDRRIVLVYSRLEPGMDADAVARVLGEQISRRSEVIRELDPDTRFGDRPVIAYVEVPDEFSMVRWFVVVDSGVQVAVGCQFLTDEWTEIRSECEQAVHTLAVE
ncbi:type VII secretion-associated protein [Rhodococcus chondri]|uniref:Type VII secretion-associated protein n=1 Tax=Rhodococcus chondri TaxID=3065941 RepID=A0ABU7JW45_9NOCA|nr:type VII secretion-associated protein [Rhodococcus sp. CC-R104]MEE2034232.1 type VII secretion-associated protein [Rhodococcus sp. CC-R104]